MVVVVVVLIPSQPFCRTPADHSLTNVRSKCRGSLDIHNERSPVREPRRATTSPGRPSHNIGLSRSCMPTDHSCTPHCRHNKMQPRCCQTATPMLTTSLAERAVANLPIVLLEHSPVSATLRRLALGTRRSAAASTCRSLAARRRYCDPERSWQF